MKDDEVPSADRYIEQKWYGGMEEEKGYEVQRKKEVRLEDIDSRPTSLVAVVKKLINTNKVGKRYINLGSAMKVKISDQVGKVEEGGCCPRTWRYMKEIWSSQVYVYNIPWQYSMIVVIQMMIKMTLTLLNN